MPLNAGQAEVAFSNSRFKVVIAGRRWGKTYLAIRELARSCRLANKRAFYVAPTYRQAKQIVWDQLKYRLQDLNWVEKTNESDLTITLRNGSRISLRGADNPDSLRGVGLDAVVLDEFAMIDERAWTEVLRPTLSDRQGSAMFISTPMGQANWAFDLYNKGVNQEQGWASFQYTTLSGGNVSAEEIESARRDLDIRTFRQEYEATWEQYANRIFYSFDRKRNIRAYEGPTPAVIYVGIDFNIDPMSAVVFHREGPNVIHAIDTIEMYSSNTDELVRELLSRYPKSRIWCYPDPASRQRKTSAGGATDLTILQNAGFVVKAPNAHNPIRDGINAVNSKLSNSLGEASFFIDPKCRKLIECLEKLTYKEGTTQPDKDSGFDHMADAMRYAIDYMFPVRRDIDPEQLAPQRWGHTIGNTR